MIELKKATIEEIDDVIALHNKYHIFTILEEDKKDGFVTTAFTYEELKDLIEKEEGLFIAKKDDKVIAYIMSASWKFWSAWPMFEYMIKHLEENQFLNQKLTTKNSYQYGPICIDKDYRGTTLLLDLFEFARINMSKRFPILVTFINKINTRSFEAHTRKLKLEVINEFEYCGKNYYELCYDTSKSVFA